MGEREITARSDVYSLGAMTYEMLMGEPPYTGPTAQAIVAKVLRPIPNRYAQSAGPYRSTWSLLFSRRWKNFPPIVLRPLQNLPTHLLLRIQQLQAQLSARIGPARCACGHARKDSVVGRRSPPQRFSLCSRAQADGCSARNVKALRPWRRCGWHSRLHSPR